MVFQGCSVVVAAYNEGPSLATTLDRILAHLAIAEPRREFELIVVDDGSSDGTPGLLEEYSARRPGQLSVVRHAQNRGLVAAMRTGCESASLPIVVFLDADLSYAPETIDQLLAGKEASGAAVAVASPYMRGGQVANIPLDRLLASRAANWMLALCSGGRVATFTGMVRAYDTALMRDLFAQPVVGEFNTWALATLIAADSTLVEVPAVLAWPIERRRAAPRMSFAQLRDRTIDVIKTIRYLRGACRRSVKYKTGTLVLTTQPTRL